MKRLFPIFLILALLIPYRASANQFAYTSAVGGGDMLKSVYDLAGGEEQVAFASDLIGDGTAPGQMLFWGSSWDHTETSELVWDETGKMLGIGISDPVCELHVYSPTGGVTLIMAEVGTSGGAFYGLKNSVREWGFGINGSEGFTIRDDVGGGNVDVFEIESGAPYRSIYTLPSGKTIFTTTTGPQVQVAYDGLNYSTLETSSTGDLIFGPSGNGAVIPFGKRLIFGDLDTYVYEFVDDNLRLVVGGVPALVATSNVFSCAAASAARFMNVAATRTMPTLLPRNNDASNNTGVGSGGEDELSIVAGGIEATRTTETAGAIDFDVFGAVDAVDLVRPQYTGSYDGSDYFTFRADSGGDLTVTATGGDIILSEDTTITGVLTVNDLEHWKTSEIVADDATIALSAVKSGSGWVQIGDNQEYTQFRFGTSGTVTLINSTANVSNSSVDGDLCVYLAAGLLTIENKLGGPLTVRVDAGFSN